MKFTFLPDGRAEQSHFNYPSPLARKLWSYVLSMGCARCKPGYAVEMQGKRNGYVLHYARAGEMEHAIQGRRFILPAGSACLIDSSHQRIQRNPGRRSLQLWWVFFSGRDLARTVAELGTELDPVFPIIDRSNFEKSFHHLWRLIVHQPAAHEVQTHVILQQLIAELFMTRVDKLRVQSLIPDKSKLSESVRYAVNLMESLYHKPMGLKHIARESRLSVYHFTRKFHAECGMSPMQFMRRYRMDQAKFILRNSDKSIREVAEMVGFLNDNYFGKSFRRATGISPHKFRRQHL